MQTSNLLTSPDQSQAYLYQAGTSAPIGSQSTANDLNNQGQIVGVSAFNAATTAHAFLYAQGQLQDLGTLGGATSIATAINSVGQVVGISDTASSSPSTGLPPPSHMFLYKNGVMTDLGSATGALRTTPYAINDGGLIVGIVTNASSLSAGLTQAFVYQNNAITPLPGLGADSGALGVNNQGRIVGFSRTADSAQQHAVTWQNGQLTDLGTLSQGNHALAAAVNTAGDIVGGAVTPDNTLFDRAFLYHNC